MKTRLCFLSAVLLSVMLSEITLFSADRSPVPADPQALITLPLSKKPVPPDGAISLENYDDAVVLGGNFVFYAQGMTPCPNSPIIYIKRDLERLYLAYDNPMAEGERPKMDAAIPDHPGICADNVMELYIMPERGPSDLLSFIQFAGNPRGVVFDTKQTPQIGISDVSGFSIDWRLKNNFIPGRWLIQIAPRLSDLLIKNTADGRGFDIDFERDGGFGCSGASGYCAAFAGIQSGKGVKVKFQADAPAVQWLSFGEFEKFKGNPKLRMKSSGKAGKYAATFQIKDAVGKDGQKLDSADFAEKAVLEVPAGGEANFSWNKDISSVKSGKAYYMIEDETGSQIFFRTYAFTTGNPPWKYPRPEIKPFVCNASMVPSYGRIVASADIINLPGDHGKFKVNVSVVREGGGGVLAKGVIEKFSFDFGQLILDVGRLEAGTYIVKFNAANSETGEKIGDEQTAKVVRKIYEWENNSIGIGGKVMDPWPPMSLEGETAKCWGREYKFTGLGLPASIRTLQPEPSRGEAVRDVLAEPVQIVAEKGGTALHWNDGEKAVRFVNETMIEVSGSSAAQGLKAEVKGGLEFDGFYKVHLKIIPEGAVTLDSLRVEIPMPTDIARLFFSVGESMRTNHTFADFEDGRQGVLWDSRSAAHNQIVKGNFLPVAWIGDDDRGIAWMADNDRSWVLDFEKPCLDVLRKGDKTSFRIHLLNRPGELKRPIETVFSIQATPVKPRLPGGSWKKSGWYGWGFFDKPLIYDGCFDLERKRSAEENPWFVDEDARKEKKWWRYFCFNSDRISESDPIYGQMVKDFSAEWYFPAPLAGFKNKARIDFILWAYKQWADKAGLKGCYHDNTYPVAWPGLANGSGWIDDEGNLRAGYWVMADREFMKRERALWLQYSKPPVMNCHITDCPAVSYLGFSDWWMDGENGGYPDSSIKDPDFVDRWANRTGMANLRITLGSQWGVMPSYLYSWKRDPTTAVLSLFNIDKPDQLYKGSWKVAGLDYNFGVDEADCVFMPFWDVRKPVKVTPDEKDVLASSWKRPGRARIHVANFADVEKQVNIRLDTKELGIPENAVATDEQTGDPVDMWGGEAVVTVARHNYRVILLAAPGTFTPLKGDALAPPKQKPPLKVFGFSDKDAGWKFLPEDKPDIRFPGAIRLEGLPHVAVRDFDLVDCSVQARASCYSKSSDGPSSLIICWTKDKYLQMGIGNQASGPSTITARAVAGGKELASFNGPAASAHVWLKICTAKRLGIGGFLFSTDGKTWTNLGEIPDKEFSGAPSKLILGNAITGEKELFLNEPKVKWPIPGVIFDEIIAVDYKDIPNPQL